jgi:hypothetical protein
MNFPVALEYQEEWLNLSKYSTITLPILLADVMWKPSALVTVEIGPTEVELIWKPRKYTSDTRILISITYFKNYFKKWATLH